MQNANDLEDMAYRTELPYDKVLTLLDIQYVSASTIGYNLQPGKHESSGVIWMVESSLPKEVKE